MAAHIESAAQRGGLEAQIAAQVEGYNAGINRLQAVIAQHEAAHQPCEVILHATVDRLNQTHENDITRMRAEHDIQVAQLKAEHERALDTCGKKNESLVALHSS